MSFELSPCIKERNPLAQCGIRPHETKEREDVEVVPCVLTLWRTPATNVDVDLSYQIDLISEPGKPNRDVLKLIIALIVVEIGVAGFIVAVESAGDDECVTPI